MSCHAQQGALGSRTRQPYVVRYVRPDIPRLSTHVSALLLGFRIHVPSLETERRKSNTAHDSLHHSINLLVLSLSLPLAAARLTEPTTPTIVIASVKTSSAQARLTFRLGLVGRLQAVGTPAYNLSLLSSGWSCKKLASLSTHTKVSSSALSRNLKSMCRTFHETRMSWTGEKKCHRSKQEEERNNRAKQRNKQSLHVKKIAEYISPASKHYCCRCHQSLSTLLDKALRESTGVVVMGVLNTAEVDRCAMAFATYWLGAARVTVQTQRIS